MKIIDIGCEDNGNDLRVYAHIDKLELWFRYPTELGFDSKDATPFVIAALVPAMLLGEDIEVDNSFTVSPRLLTTVDQIMSTYQTWNPVFQPVKIIARSSPGQCRNNGNASFFSGGVDGTYSLLKHLDDIEKTVLINGFDFTMDDKTWNNMVRRNREFSESLGKPLIAVETNFKSFTAAFGLARLANHGSVLACIAQLLGFSKAILSAATTYDLIHANGCHPLIDPLFSTETTELLHLGLEADRSDKIAYINHFPKAMENLWVCWKDPRYNCGRCPKCVRTHVALRLNGIEDFNFQSPASDRDISRLFIKGDEELLFFEKFLHRAQSQNLRTLENQLCRKIIVYRLKQIADDLFKHILPPICQQWRLARRGDGDKIVDISIIPRYSDQYSRDYHLQKLRDIDFHQEEPKVGSIYG